MLAPGRALARAESLPTFKLERARTPSLME
jgi:hypothetical protein